MGLPNYAEDHLHRKDLVNDFIGDYDISNRSDCDDPLVIPVAVHFQGVGVDMACATEMALDQVEILNNDFAGTNADISTWEDLNPAIWPGITNGESCICFCLATLNHPAGFGLDDGDYAVTLDETAGDSDGSWSGYLNFFVRDIGGGVLGYSPLGGLGNGDGVTCGPDYFGSVSCGGNAVNPPYHLGRTITHEVGHYLFLEHPWGAGGCASTDDVVDTPVTDGPTFGCPGAELINCVDPVLWPSYMDYCDDLCLFMFSQDQVERMESYVQTSLTNVLDNSVTVCQESICLDFDVDVNFDHESCSGNDVSIVLVAEGGAGPYNFSINDGGSFVGDGMFDSLSESDYSIIVTDANACEFTDEVSLLQEEPTLELLDKTNEYCSDNAGSITVLVNEPSVFEYSLNGADWQADPTFIHLSGGVYMVQVQNDAGCSGEIEVIIENESDLEVQVQEYQPVNCSWFDNGSLTLNVQGGTAPILYVLDGFQISDNGMYSELSAGEHSIFVSDADGCETTSLVDIPRSYETMSEDCPCKVYIPNAITADGDGNNELLDVVPSCPITEFHIQIFNRWGNLVFESFEVEERWNGGINGYYVEDEIYIYRLTYLWGEDDNTGIEVQTESGHVIVFR
jgi:gliding motility-associated-like protein